jgi:hypothetical protein
MTRGIKLSDLTPERLAEAGFDVPPPPKQPRTVADLREDVRAIRAGERPEANPKAPTRAYAVAQLRHAYRHLVSGRTVVKPKSFANLVSPAIIYLESLGNAGADHAPAPDIQQFLRTTLPG